MPPAEHPLVAFVVAELRDEGIPKPSAGVVWSYLRSAVLAGRAREIGLHLLHGLERVRITDAKTAAMAAPDVFVEVWAPDPQAVRDLAGPWIADARELRIMLAVHPPGLGSRWHARRTWLRWRLRFGLWRLGLVREQPHVEKSDRSASTMH